VRFPCATRQVVVGKSMATGRDDRYFGLVRSQDEQPGRRFCEVVRPQALPVTQTVTMLTDGGDSVAGLVSELSPGAVHIVDWFHIALRLTGLDPYVKGLAHHNPVEALALQHRLERITWRLWQGDDDEALTRAQGLAADVAALRNCLQMGCPCRCWLDCYFERNKGVTLGGRRAISTPPVNSP
jgi:hypothetical protein